MSYELLNAELDYILERNNVSRRKLLMDSIFESNEKANNEKLDESTRLVYAFHFARCYATFLQIYPYYEKHLKSKL